MEGATALVSAVAPFVSLGLERAIAFDLHHAAPDDLSMEDIDYVRSHLAVCWNGSSGRQSLLGL
jgi:hypothetical protein